MNIYICDDEATILESITATIHNIMPDDNIQSFTSGAELLKSLQDTICDILFLDIDMPDLSGMDIVNRMGALEHKPLIVFVTSHDELVYESMQYHPFGFIRKSYFQAEIEKVLADCKEELRSKQKHFHFKSSGEDIRLLLSEIMYFEADGNYLIVYTGSDAYRFRSTVTTIENSLMSSGFVRTHKGFLVNVQAVKILGKEELELINGTMIPIGKSYSDTTKKKILSFMRM